MNKMKKTGITMLAVAICVLLSVTVLAITFISVDITATADKNVYCVTGVEQLATVTIKADRQIDIISLDACVILPEGWTIESVTNDEIDISYFNDEKNTDNRIVWYAGGTTNVNTTNLLEITVKIPADVTVGEYEVGIENLELAKLIIKDNTFDTDIYAQSLTVTATLTVKEHDYETTYDFAADGKICTAERVCKNDTNHVETATATISSEITTPATCEGMGKTTYTATFDKAWAAKQTKTVEDVAPINHAWGEATYDFAEDGKICTAERVCKNDAAHVETATATISSEITTPATCEGMGETTYTATFDKGWAATKTKTVEDVAPINHAWGEVTYDFAADGKTCTAERVCKNDAAHVETAIATISSEITTPATCEGMGETTYTATFDKAWAAKQTKTVEDVAPINHAWGEATYDFAADGKTCTAERVCKNDAAHVETANATISSEITTPATCEGMGETTYTATFDKTWAATKTKTVEDVAPINHAWGEVTYNFAEDGKTCTAERVCKNDVAHVETATATITSEITTPATCEGMGKTTYTATFDKAWAKLQTKTVEDVESIGHDWGETTYDFAADGKSCTAKRVCKNDASHVETAIATITSEVTKDPTCTEKGETTYTATFVEDWAATQPKTVEDVESIGHDWGEASYKDNGDGTHTATYTCKNDKTHTKSDDPAEHVYADGECVCGAIEPIKGLKGDVNLDGSVDAKDATALARHLARLDILTDETALYNADTNSDGVVDAKDATKLARYLARLIDSFDEE